ncbi:transposase [Bradyrhizobium sp. WSM2254]|uniref:transposase n=1 Tax=Bradyrhizobium sp. WSM2254 TaxID=1188263 RepID=UPI0035263354
MKPSWFTDEQIMGSCGSRRRARPRPMSAASTGSPSATLYKWKAKYGGLEVSDAKRLKARSATRARAIMSAVAPAADC